MDFFKLEKFLEKKIEHATTFVLGSSVLNRFIYAVEFDFGSDKTVIIQGAIHAREHITALLLCKFIEHTSANFNKYKAQNFPNIIFVPMVNPDGVELCCNGLKSVKDRKRRKFLVKINKGKDFSLFKANANGVDLNTNFDAKWGSGVENKIEPSSNGFIGESPMCEPEVQSLALLTNKVKPFFTISYHAKGQELYYRFYNEKENLKRDGKIAKLLSRALRYKVKNTERCSSGGYKDWCVFRHKIPSVTIEVGKDSLKHPIEDCFLDKIYKRNKCVIKLLGRINREYEKFERRKIYERGAKGSKESL